MEKRTHILLVDDEENILEPLDHYLKSQGLETSLARDAKSALELIKKLPIDLAVLDIMLGQSDGLELCRDIQHVKPMPVIFLSGRAEDTERIIGLELGADDYLAKPFNPRELLARIRAVLRRYASPATASHDEKLKIGPWQLDVSNQELMQKDGSRLELSTGETRLLYVFLSHPDMVLSRDELLKMTQGRQTNPFDRSIDNYVSRLRKKIESDPSNPIHIKTYWGGGYAFNSKGNLGSC
ncbi:response regulator [Kordiimonas aestuarii]|uniref:response regulator n=1 Tax=Kordiimonas aestuarii TaxID=1005925 RepID=UPI0021D03EE0|nr:response regulator [Kordiimonas aestuarii]